LTANGFKDATRDPHTIRKFFGNPDAILIGVPTGAASGFDVVDLDPRHGSDQWRVEHIADMPETRIHRTPGGGEHWLFIHAPGVQNSAGRLGPGVDVRGEGGYIVAAGPGYCVVNDGDIAPLPNWLLEKTVKRKPEPKAVRPASEAQRNPDQLAKRYQAYVDSLLANVRNAAQGQKHDTLLANARALGGILAVAGISERDALAWLLAALPASVKDWHGAERTALDGLRRGLAMPFDLEDRPGYSNKSSEPPPAGEAKARTSQKPSSASPLDGFDLTEDGVAQAFAAKHGEELRYCHHAQHWFVWTGFYWRREESKLVFSWARELCRHMALQTHDKARPKVSKAAFSGAVERFAQADRAFAVTAETWDRDPWLLGTPGGTVDLKTGELRPSSPADHITKKTAVAPAAPGTSHPEWTKFLDAATGHDKQLQAFLQRLVGYCLTGDVTEEVLAFLYGEGGTGKGTFLGTIVAVLADYAVSVPIEVFTAGTRLNLEYYRAQMAGARLITASETEAGATWAEAQIKEMTGNETPLSGRHPYSKPFTFMPRFKIMLVGNHAPRLKGRSKAMERRMRIAPFKHKPEKPDHELKERLRSEQPAILRWCIDGCLAWDRVARRWLEVLKALLPVVPHTMRREVGRPKSSIRLSTWTATAISAFWRASVWECKPLPMTCLNRPIAASTRDRLL